MSKASKRAFIFGNAFSVAICVAYWFVLADSSPFKNYFLYHVELPNMFRSLTMVEYLVIMAINPKSELVGWIIVDVMTYLQWLIVGWILGRAIFRKAATSPTTIFSNDGN